MKILKIAIIPLALYTACNTANAALEVPLSLKGQSTTPEEVIIAITLDIVDSLSNIERTEDQDNLYNALKYAVDNSENQDPDVIAAIADMYQAISPKKNTANSIVVRKTPGTMKIKGIGKRLSALRKQSTRIGFFKSVYNSGSRDGSLYNTLPGYIKYNNPLEQGGLFDQRLSGFITGNFVSSKQSETGTEAGFDGGMQQLAFGADYRLNNKAFAGLALSLINGEVDLADNGGKLDNTAQTLLAYGTYSIEPNWYVDATINYGARSFEMTRNIGFTLNNNQTSVSSKSSPDSSYFGLSLGTGFDLNFNNGHNITLLAGLDYTDTTIDSFNESNGTGFNLHVGQQDITSIQMNIGAEWRQAISTSFGVLLPQFSATWVQEFEDKGDSINAYFISDPNKNKIEFKAGNKDQGFMNLRLGVSAVLPKGLSLFTQFETQQFVDDYQQYMISLGARKEF